jgi:hypothetical protein
MANPVNVPLSKNTWTPVATNVVAGLITIKEWQSSRYYQTFRVTGDPAPVGDHNESTSVVTTGQEISINATEAIDVYLYCYQEDGSVVVAL